MELGGVSIPGRSPGSEGACLLKDLTVFERQLGGLKAFIMVSDGTAGDESGGVAARLAVKAADAFLESILFGIAAGKSPEVDPVVTLKALLAEANNAIANASDETGSSSRGATFCGVLISAEKAWFGSGGGGQAYLLQGDEVRQLIVDNPASADTAAEDAPIEGQTPDHEDAEIAETASGYEGVETEVGSVYLSSGDALVLCGKAASAVLSASDILGISCAACDAQLAATSLADAAARAEPDHSVTVAVWSSDSSLFAPPPPPPPPPSPRPAEPVPVQAAQSGAFRASRAEKIWLWVMSAWIVVALLALVGMALTPTLSTLVGPASSSVGAGVAPEAASQGATVATTTQQATPLVEPAQTAQAEFPKTLTVPKNVKGGLWLRKKASTLGQSNLVVQLKGGADVQAVDTVQGKDASGKTQEFYVFKVSEISADQVTETDSYPWPPPKAVKTVYAFAGSFEASP